MNEKIEQQLVDQNEIRTHQTLTILMLLTGFVANSWELVATQAAIFLIAFLVPILNPYQLFFKGILKPSGLLKSDIRVDIPQAHRFTMSIGFLFTISSSYLIYSGNSTLGWGLVWLVICLGLIAVIGWCAGCFSYFMLNRMGIRGFFKYKSIKGVFPGNRPDK
jgi:uncharacterized protein DUF4395